MEIKITFPLFWTSIMVTYLYLWIVELILFILCVINSCLFLYFYIELNKVEWTRKLRWVMLYSWQNTYALVTVWMDRLNNNIVGSMVLSLSENIVFHFIMLLYSLWVIFDKLRRFLIKRTTYVGTYWVTSSGYGLLYMDMTMYNLVMWLINIVCSIV